jgi:PTS system galactitol-specific IIA component
MIWEELKESLIITEMDAKSYQDVFKQLGGTLIQEGYAKSSYIEALIAREAEFPTGLDLNGIGVAIPHTDVTHVYQSGVAIAVLKEPVTFIQMGTDDEQVQVRLIFMLSVVEPNAHIDGLQRILEIIQDQQLLQQLLEVKDAPKIIELIKEKEKEL